MHNCVAAGNTSAVPSSYGIYASFSSVITNCSAYNNGNTSGTVTPDAGVGIYASASTVKDCTCGVNKGDGIQVVNNSVVERNNSYLNGNGGDGAGIHATAFANRIESNNLVSNDRGIDVDAGGNLIIKNSARGNTNNYDIAADNRYGPIVDLTAAGTVAATGNSAPGTTVNADPQANFAY
jgi:parallel beta-helix repeat protein